MTVSTGVTTFRPSINGCHFPNSFRGPVLVVNLPFIGSVNVGNAANGVCGGMVFTARDYFEARRPIPADAVPPATGGRLYRYVTNRLFDSFRIPAGVLQYLNWMNTPDGDSRRWFMTRRGISWMTIVEQWPTIKATLDSGHPCPVGLVTVRSANPADLGANHVVLAFGYNLSDNGDLSLQLYDPNTPDADDIQLGLNIAAPTQAAPIRHNIGISGPVRGFFALSYSVQNPPTI